MTTIGLTLDPTLVYTVFDLEATTADPQTAEIIEIAALRPGCEPFQYYVATSQEYPADHEVWNITKIDPEHHAAEKRPLEEILRSFLQYIGNSPLAGHNVVHYDIPLISRHLSAFGLALLTSTYPVLDTLRWAHLRHPIPPERLRGYRLGDLYEFYTGKPLDGAHQAINDCRANLEVLRHLLSDVPHQNVLKVWAWLGLSEAQWYDMSIPEGKDVQSILQVTAKVDWVNASGDVFPSLSTLFASETNLLVSRRPSQQRMMRLIESNLQHKGQVLIQAPTGTGKTKGYLYPVHRYLNQNPGAKVVIATHTKVLQQQVLDELRRSSKEGYETRAVEVKSPRDYICLDALSELIHDLSESNLEERTARECLLTLPCKAYLI